MCGTFYVYSPITKIAAYYQVGEKAKVDWTPDYNLRPGSDVLTVTASEQRELHYMRWGLIPAWAKAQAFGFKTFNARAETVADKPTFRDAYLRRRCLIPANGFYEWPKNEVPKRKFAIQPTRGEFFSFAGLWERWQSPQGVAVQSCTIITTTPNRAMAAIHDRMPVILGEDKAQLWLDGEQRNPEALASLLVPCPDDWLTVFEVNHYKSAEAPARDSKHWIDQRVC